MLFGNKKSFGLECSYKESIKGTPLGNICLWIKGMAVGDFSEHCNLADCIIHFNHLLKWRGKRADRHLSSLELGEAIEFLFSALYTDNNKSEEASILDWTLYEKVILLPTIPPFDGWFGVVLDEKDCQRIMVSKRFDKPIEYQEIICPPASYENHINDFFYWIAECIGRDQFNKILIE